MQYIYVFLNDLRKINKLPQDIVIIHKVFKNLLVKFETFIKILHSKKIIITLVSMKSNLYIKDFEMNLQTKQNKDALSLKFKSNFEDKS